MKTTTPIISLHEPTGSWMPIPFRSFAEAPQQPIAQLAISNIIKVEQTQMKMALCPEGMGLEECVAQMKVTPAMPVDIYNRSVCNTRWFMKVILPLLEKMDYFKRGA